MLSSTPFICLSACFLSHVIANKKENSLDPEKKRKNKAKLVHASEIRILCVILLKFIGFLSGFLVFLTVRSPSLDFLFLLLLQSKKSHT